MGRFGNGISKIYINGTEVSYAAGSYNSSTGIDATMTIGSRTDGSQYFNGVLDEVSIWETVKTQCEIATEYTSKLAGDEVDLIRYYSFDSGTAGGLNTGVTTLDAGPFASSNGKWIADELHFGRNNLKLVEFRSYDHQKLQ